MARLKSDSGVLQRGLRTTRKNMAMFRIHSSTSSKAEAESPCFHWYCVSLARGGTFRQAAFLLVALVSSARNAASQTPTEPQFIASVNSAISSLTASFGTPTRPIIFSGNLVFANGQVVAHGSLDVLLNYVDGLKAAGAQRVDLNPGLTSVTNPNVKSMYSAVVQRIRQLGMQVAINPEFSPGELGQGVTFQEFQDTAVQNYPQLAELCRPDIFVIVHEPTTAAGSMGGIATTVQDWHNFILTIGPLIKAASPHTRLGAGGFQNGVLPALSAQENMYWQDFVTIPTCSASNVTSGCLDVMTMDIYNDDTFPVYNQWIQLAKTNNKGIYIEEAWTPHYLPNPLPSSALSPAGFLTQSLDGLSIVGAASADFASLDVSWLQALAQWASANGMEAITAFTTQTFFAYGAPGADKISSPGYSQAVMNAMQQGLLTDTGRGFQGNVSKLGISEVTSISSASYQLTSSAFGNFGDSIVAPDELLAGFGTDLATSTAVAQSASFPTSLGGTTMNVVDSSNTTFNAQMYSVTPQQVNFIVPSGVQSGPATVTVRSADGSVTAGIILVAPIAPGIYTANANGADAAAAIAVCAGTCSTWPTAGHVNGQFFQETFACGSAPGSCATKPLDLGAPTDTVVL